MLETYQTEIIAAISILVVVIIYIILKKSKSQQNFAEDKPQESVENNFQTKEEISEVVENKPEKEVEEQKEEIHTNDEHIDSEVLIRGTEEGSFGTQEHEEIQTKEENIPKKTRFKRDIPPHSKIVKNDFKEFAGTKILVAEDNLINQKVISGLLADTGIEITIADDGQDALDILEKDSDFAFILMDAHMPRVDGFEATKIIRENPNYDHILVVALSGDTAADDIKKMRDAGMEEQLEKPLRMDALYDILYAYSGAPKKEENDKDFIEVIMTKELDGDKGLEICGGDKSFYDEILNEFVNTYSNSATKLDEFLNNKQIEQADRFLLDIIGITANIGANNLNNIAKNLKESIQNIQEENYLKIFKEYQQHLSQLLKDIEEYK